MRAALRIVSFAVGMALFVWAFSHAGGFHKDGSPVDPNPPPFYLHFAGVVAAVLLWLYAIGAWKVFSGPRHEGDSAAMSTPEPSRPPQPATGPVSVGEQSPPDR